MSYLKMYFLLSLLIIILSSCTSRFSHYESEALLNESVNSQEVFFPEDFFVEYDENGLAILKKYLGTGGDVIIPDGINIIGEHVFDLLSYKDDRIITTVYIPDTVTIISDYAFLCCYYSDEGFMKFVCYRILNTLEKVHSIIVFV